MMKWSPVSPPIKMALMLMFMLLLMVILAIPVLTINYTLMLEWNLMVYKSISITIPLLIDKMSTLFSATVIIISFSVMLFSSSYMSNDPNLKYFTIMVMLFIMSMNCLIFFPSLLTLLIGWDGLGLTSYLLVIYYSNSKSLAAGMLTAMTNRIGDALLIMAVSWMLMMAHWNLSLLKVNLNIMIMIMIILAAMTKSAQMPFSAWLPAAMAAPTPVSALVHSSTLVTAGVYLLIRFFPSLHLFWVFKLMCFYLGAITCMMASMSAMYENDLKKIIALSTLSQLGIMMMALGMEQPLLAFFHLITHALFKALLFICAGSIIHTMNNNQDIRLMGNITLMMPVTITTLNVANLSLCGIPFLAGFYSKDAIIETFFLMNMPISSSIILLSSVYLTAAYSMRLSFSTLWSTYKGPNISQYTSPLTYGAYLILIIGTTTGGATLNMMIKPIMFTPVIPLVMKMMTVHMVIMFMLMMFLLMKYNIMMPISNFMSSMWFLTLISSSPINSKLMNVSKMFIYNELTWMEKMSGKMLKLTLFNYVPKTQMINKMNMSNMLSLFSILMVLMMVYFM